MKKIDVPPSYVFIDVVLPEHKAYIVRRWAEAAQQHLDAMKEDKKPTNKLGQTKAIDPGNNNEEAKGIIGGRYRVTRVHHPCFSRLIGLIVIAKEENPRGYIWAYDDKPITYRTLRNGQRVVDSDPRCILTLYHIDDLELIECPEK